MKICFILANSGGPDEMLPNAAFHLGLHCLLKHLFNHFLELRTLESVEKYIKGHSL